MKKKMLLGLLIVLGLCTITGCGCSKKESNNNEEKEVDDSLVVVNGVELHLNQEKEYQGIKYTITDDLDKADFDYVIQYYKYQDSGPNLMFFRIFVYEGKSRDEIKYDLAIEDEYVEGSGKTDNVEYQFIDLNREDGTIHFYLIDKDNKTYVVNFVSQYDIKDFEKKVLNSVKF